MKTKNRLIALGMAFIMALSAIVSPSLFSSDGPDTAEAASSYYVTKNMSTGNSNVYLHSSAGGNSIPSVTMAANKAYVRESTDTVDGMDWYKITVEGTTGWVSSTGAISVTKNTSVYAKTTNTGKTKRNGPGTSFTSLGSVPTGTNFYIIGGAFENFVMDGNTNNLWYQMMDSNNDVFWIKGNDLTTIQFPYNTKVYCDPARYIPQGVQSVSSFRAYINTDVNSSYSADIQFPGGTTLYIKRMCLYKNPRNGVIEMWYYANKIVHNGNNYSGYVHNDIF